MNGMFYSCSNLNNLDLSPLDTKNVTYISGMFYLCSSLKKLDLKTFNIKNVTKMNAMLHKCFGLTEINVSYFETRNVIDMQAMFKSCENIKYPNASNFYINDKTGIIYFISNCKSLTTLDLFCFDNITYEIELLLYNPKSFFLNELKEIKIKKEYSNKIKSEKIPNNITLIYT